MLVLLANDRSALMTDDLIVLLNLNNSSGGAY